MAKGVIPLRILRWKDYPELFGRTLREITSILLEAEGRQGGSNLTTE